MTDDLVETDDTRLLGRSLDADAVQTDLDALLEDGGRVRRVALVGASFGGLVVRELATRLAADARWDGVERTLVATIASPHLGIRGFYQASAGVRFFAARVQAFAEMQWDDGAVPVLSALAAPDALAALAAFRTHLLFVPSEDDGMVCPASARIDGATMAAGAGGLVADAADALATVGFDVVLLDTDHAVAARMTARPGDEAALAVVRGIAERIWTELVSK
jgi:hypothetical protein